MSLAERLADDTRDGRNYLLSAPVIERTLTGRVTAELYISFLVQAYHHVRHTVPLMMALGSRLPERLMWLRKDVAHYVEEELGHEEWILNDIDAAGGDSVLAKAVGPNAATDAMVAYAYDTVSRRNPVGFFGMVYVLEGTSAAIALQAADCIANSLALPARALTYLRSHGRLDQEHTHHLQSIFARLESEDDRCAVIQCARTMYWLYGNVFRQLDAAADPTASETRRVA